VSLRRLSVAFVLVVFGLAIGPSSSWALDTPLITSGSVWSYLDNGSNQGTAWRGVGFNDSGWATGPAQLGYGDGDEATVVSYGPDANNKYITTYLRRTFNVVDPNQFTSLKLNMIRDDGAVVYINGVEVWRLNLPSGTIAFNTLATVAVPDETAWQTASIGSSVLVAGTNTIAVEMHQSAVTSSDISFDFSMTGSDVVSVTRGPYLQLGTHNAMTVRWRTDADTDSQLRFGNTPGVLTGTVTDGALTTEHELRLTGLSPDTKYFYQVGTTTVGLSGNDAATYFYTNPTPGTVRSYRFWVIGDAGTGNIQQINVRNAFDTFNSSTRIGGWLMLGDNAYENGTAAEYQTNVYNIYPTIFRNVVLRPALGNHDTAQATNPPASLPYFQMFTLPNNAEAGGFPSGTEKYYSFDYGNIHFVELDSMASSRSSTGAMANWLRSDLAQNTKRWTVAYWHHAPYSFGTHNSDTEIELAEMRANLNPILENGGVDLVLSGHSHSYERSYLIDGHYGTSSTFTQSMKVDATGGPYSKPGVNVHEGTVYIVAGTSGRVGSLLPQAPYPAMYSSLTEAGSLVLDVNGDQMAVRFLTETGSVADTITINKGVVATRPAAPNGLTASAISSSQINLTWADNSSNEDGFKIERSTDGTNFAQIAVVPANTTGYSNTGLSASTLYYYRVYSYNTAGNSTSPSNTAPATTSGPTVTTLISNGASWRYLDNGSNQGTSWRAISFNDNSWRTGMAQLGFGDGDEQTLVSFGPNPKKKYITTYFRRAITVTNPAQFTSVNLSLIRDDGAVVLRQWCRSLAHQHAHWHDQFQDTGCRPCRRRQ
jgi:calcineurin-like phosphoesterase family protein/purple acid phosphatase-like protein/fibronectin type III domain protein